MLIAVILAEGLTAFCALAFEVAAARLVAPHAGMSTDTWTAIIAAFLLALALGNRIGGRLATDASVANMLARAAIAALMGGAAVAVTPFVMNVWDAVILAPAPAQLWRIVLFAALPCIPAGLMFGIATPLLMTGAMALAGGGGIIVGMIYAAGATGSVFGVLAVLWLLFDTLGTKATLLTIGALAACNAMLIACAATALRQRVAVA